MAIVAATHLTGSPRIGAFNRNRRSAGAWRCKQSPLSIRVAAPAAARQHACAWRCRGKVILVSGHEPCLVDDLSLTGASVSIGRDAPPIGDSAVLMVNGIEAFGTVVWHSGVHFGLCFEDPVTRDDLVRVRGIHDHFTAIEMDRQRRNARDFVQGRPV